MLNIIAFLIIVAGLIQSLLFAGHWALYKTIVRFFSIENPIIIIYLKIILGFLSISFVLAMIFSSRYSNLPVRVFYNLAAGWLGFLFFLLVASAVGWIILGAGKYWSFNFDWKILISILYFLAIILGTYGLVNAGNVRITKLNIKLNNLPESWKGRTAVWVSDIHLGQIRDYKFSQQVADKIQNLQPDVIFVGGDLYDGVQADIDKLATPFARLKAPLGTYFITGNHEEFDGSEKYLAAARKVNMQILDNKSIDLDGVQLIGVDYRDTSEREPFKKILAEMNIQKNKPVILLKHSPYYVEEAEKAGVDLQLSGHTHRGQVIPIMYIDKLIFYGYEFGLKKLGNLLIYTSSGAGTWGPPFRVGTTPEIVQITFN